MNELNEGRNFMGKRLAKKIKYTKKQSGIVLYEQVYSLLDPFTGDDGSSWSAISEDDYKRYTPEQVLERATAFLTFIEKCNDFTVLNAVVMDDENCDTWHCTGEFTEPVVPEGRLTYELEWLDDGVCMEWQQEVNVIGYNREILLDFGTGTFIKQ